MRAIEEARQKIERLKEKFDTSKEACNEQKWALEEAKNALAALIANAYVVIAREDYNQNYMVELQGVSQEITSHVQHLRLSFTPGRKIAIKSVFAAECKRLQFTIRLAPGETTRFAVDYCELNCEYKIVACSTLEEAEQIKEQLLLEDPYRDYRNGLPYPPGTEPPSHLQR